MAAMRVLAIMRPVCESAPLSVVQWELSVTVLSVSREFVFIHLHKCGGSSFETAYQAVSNWNDVVLGSTPEGEALQEIYRPLHGLDKHSPAKRVKAVIGDECWNRYWTFALIRHPQGTYESFYRWIPTVLQRNADKAGMSIQDLAKVDPEKPGFGFLKWGASRAYLASEDFPGFVHHVLENRLLPGTIYSRLAQEGQLIVDDVFKLEEIDSFWAVVSERIGVDLSSMRVNAGEKKVTVWTPEMRDAIAANHKKDFAAFGYEPYLS